MKSEFRIVKDSWRESAYNYQNNYQYHAKKKISKSRKIFLQVTDSAASLLAYFIPFVFTWWMIFITAPLAIGYTFYTVYMIKNGKTIASTKVFHNANDVMIELTDLNNKWHLVKNYCDPESMIRECFEIVNNKYADQVAHRKKLRKLTLQIDKDIEEREKSKLSGTAAIDTAMIQIESLKELENKK